MEEEADAENWEEVHASRVVPVSGAERRVEELQEEQLDRSGSLVQGPIDMTRLPELDEGRADASGPVFAGRAHLVFFLHDEVIVHAPAAQADAAAEAIREAAASAGRLLFGDAPVDFPLDLTIGERAAAK